MVSLGSTTLIGPNVSIYSAGHPTNPDLRNGTKGPEWGRPITIEDDCWITGNVIILPGVITSDGCTIGAGSVVTKVRCETFTVTTVIENSDYCAYAEVCS